jgi:hypothetical protein
MVKIISRLLASISVLAMVVGCGSYYRVTDPASKNIYYTDEIDQIKGGAVKFRDAKTGSDVTLQSSEVKEIKSEEFEEVTKTPQPAEKK